MNDINSGAREKSNRLTKKEVLAFAYAIRFASPAYTAAPDKFLDRPALTVSYRTDLDRVRALDPEPLVVEDPVVNLTFLFMVAPGLGDYYEVSQGISVLLNDKPLSFRPAMSRLFLYRTRFATSLCLAAKSSTTIWLSCRDCPRRRFTLVLTHIAKIAFEQ